MSSTTTLDGGAGRYTLLSPIGSGGMATVHLGRLRGAAGFSRIVAIKRLHAQFANDPSFVAMFTDEARIASQICHPNVTSVVDVVASETELFLVMEYVHGEVLSSLIRESIRSGDTIPLGIVGALMRDVLAGLHAAHEVRDDAGLPLEIVHRDVSPDNVIVSASGVAQLLDFGVAKAVGRSQVTREGQIKGKLAYMPPEQLMTRAIDRRVDVYAAAAVLWTLLTGRRLFGGDEANLVYQILHARVMPPSELAAHVSSELDAVVLRGLSRDPEGRFETALDMADALEDVLAPASPREVGAWVERLAGESLRRRAELRAEIEVASSGHPPPRAFEDEPGSDERTLDARGPEAAGSTQIVSSLARRSDEGRSILRRRSTLVVVGALALAGLGLGATVPSRQPALELTGGVASSAHAAVVLAAAPTPEPVEVAPSQEAAPEAASAAPVLGPGRTARSSASSVSRRPGLGGDTPHPGSGGDTPHPGSGGAPRPAAAGARQGTLPSGDHDYGF